MPKTSKRVTINSMVLSKSKLIKGVNKKIDIIPTKSKSINLSKVVLSTFNTNDFKIEFLTDADRRHIKTINKLRHHKAVLNSIGIDNTASLNNVVLRGKISPSVGVFHSGLLNTSIEKNDLMKQNLFRIDSMKMERIDAAIIDTKSSKVRKIRNNSTVNVLPSLIANPKTITGSRNAFPIGQSYIAASTLQLSSYSTIIINEDITDLIIIANNIITDSNNINITWNKPILNPAPSHGIIGTASIGVRGTHGSDGNKGSDGREFAPNVEIWTLNPIRDTSGNTINSSMKVNLVGQDGGSGGFGQSGGNGGKGQNGDDGVGNSFNCVSGPKAGKDGAKGGDAGAGGNGGLGGNGGNLEIYAPNTVLSTFSNTVLINNGGKGGAGSHPGRPGNGGNGGKRGFAPKMCANTNWKKRGRIDGKKGPNGARKYMGIKGSNGFDGNVIQLNPINAAIYNQTLNSPGIIDYNPKKLSVGDAMTIYGINFSSADIVQIDGQPITSVFNNTFPNQIQNINMPDIEGGWKDITIINTSSYVSNSVQCYLTPRIQTISKTRIKPGESLVITGTGFSSHCEVLLNNQKMTNVTFLSKNTIECVIERPTSILKNPDGEVVSIKIIDNYNNYSNTMSLTLDTYRILFVGDSIMAGQGHDESDMFSTMVTNHVQTNNQGIGVYGTNIAHSGATIEKETDTNHSTLDKEIPRSFPSIKAQLNTLIANNNIVNQNVELIVLDGGINDMGIFTFITPELLQIPHENRMQTITNLAYTYSYEKMSELLAKIANTFPNAKVLVTGYYQVISEESSLRHTASYIGLHVAGFLGVALSQRLFNTVVIQCNHAAKELNKNLENAVNDANSNFNTSNFKFVDPKFKKSNALFASNKFLYGFNSIGQVQDPLQVRRASICNDAFCRKASVGHPNKQGVKQYFNRIKVAL